MKYFAGQNLIILIGLGVSLAYKASVYRPLKLFRGKKMQPFPQISNVLF